MYVYIQPLHLVHVLYVYTYLLDFVNEAHNINFLGSFEVHV